MQRAGTHKLHGRGRSMFLHPQVCLARVLNRQRAVADGRRWAALGALRPVTAVGHRRVYHDFELWL
jgi:hypothetical protein